MRILHVSWEYPPVVYGGLGRHVHSLAEEQARQGHHVAVLTQRPLDGAESELRNGVELIRIAPPLPERPSEPNALVEWITGLDFAMSEAATVVAQDFRPHVVHAHDWVVARTGNVARLAVGVPLVTTLHATEAGRHQGWIHGTVSTTIHDREFGLANVSQRIITCSKRMRADVNTLFGINEDTIDVIPNGIDAPDWRVPAEDVEAARQRWAPRGTLIVFVGRLEWEKGVHTLIEAMVNLAARDVHLVIAGTGSYESALVEQARDLIESDRITITGWLPHADLTALQAAADVIVVPSLYEPFGLVALEAGALDVPVVVADTGGLTDVVDGGDAGLLFKAGDSTELARAIQRAVDDHAGTAHRVAAMRTRIDSIFRWDRVAQQTVNTYEAAVREHAVRPRPQSFARALRLSSGDTHVIEQSGGHNFV